LLTNAGILFWIAPLIAGQTWEIVRRFITIRVIVAERLTLLLKDGQQSPKPWLVYLDIYLLQT
jgi:hypothetical protein